MAIPWAHWLSLTLYWYMSVSCRPMVDGACKGKPPKPWIALLLGTKLGSDPAVSNAKCLELTI